MKNERLEEVIDNWICDGYHTDDFYIQIKDYVQEIPVTVYRASAHTKLTIGEYMSSDYVSFTKDFLQLRDFLGKDLDCLRGDDELQLYIFRCKNCIGFDIQHHLLSRGENFIDNLDFYQEAEVVVPDILEVTAITPILEDQYVDKEYLQNLGLTQSELAYLNIVDVEQHTTLKPVTFQKSPTYYKKEKLLKDYFNRYTSYCSGEISEICPYCSNHIVSLSDCVNQEGEFHFCCNPYCHNAFNYTVHSCNKIRNYKEDTSTIKSFNINHSID